MPLPVADVDDAPEVFHVRGHRLEREDIAPRPVRDALLEHVAVALHRYALATDPEVVFPWDQESRVEQDRWLGRAEAAVAAIEAVQPEVVPA